MGNKWEAILHNKNKIMNFRYNQLTSGETRGKPDQLFHRVNPGRFCCDRVAPSFVQIYILSQSCSRHTASVGIGVYLCSGSVVVKWLRKH